MVNYSSNYTRLVGTKNILGSRTGLANPAPSLLCNMKLVQIGREQRGLRPSTEERQGAPGRPHTAVARFERRLFVVTGNDTRKISYAEASELCRVERYCCR